MSKDKAEYKRGFAAGLAMAAAKLSLMADSASLHVAAAVDEDGTLLYDAKMAQIGIGALREAEESIRAIISEQKP